MWPPLAPGSVADAGDYRVTLLQWTDPLQPRNQFDRPPAGKRYVAGEFLFETGPKGKVSVSPAYFKGKDSAGFQFDTAFGGFTDGMARLDSIALDPNAKSQGWVVFAVQGENTVSELRYAPLLSREVLFEAPAR